MPLNPNPSDLDQSQIIQRVFDSSSDELRVNASVTIGTLDVNIQHTFDSIRLGNGVDYITSTTNGLKIGYDMNIINSGQQTKVNSIPVVIASDQDPLTVSIAGGSLSLSIDAYSATPDNILLVGTDDGSKTGIKYAYVNNKKQQILLADNRQEAITWADFGTKQERITQIDYTSVTFPGVTTRKTLSYTLVGTQYRLDNVSWSIF